MEYLKILLYVVEVVVCLMLGLVVMLQKPKEGGLGGAFGGSALEASLGADAGNVLIKATSVLGAIFLINTLIIVALTSGSTSAVKEGLDGANAAAEQTAGGAPAGAPAGQQ